MKNITNLLNNEYDFICNEIPFREIKEYFKHNSSEFNKIKKGFRPDKVSEADARKLLKDNKKNHFISSFVDKKISLWLGQIQNAFDNCEEKDDVKKSINVLKDSYFKNNPELYFKLIKKDINVNELNTIKSGLEFVNIGNDNKEIENKYKTEIEKLKSELISAKSELSKSEKTYKNLEKKNKSLEGEIAKVRDKNKELVDINRKYDELCKKIAKIENNYENLKCEKNKLSIELDKEIEKRKTFEEKSIFLEKYKNDLLNKYNLDSKSLFKPDKIDEFELALEENLYGNGFDNDNNGVALLARYLNLIIFNGRPIIINKNYSEKIINSINNSLLGNENIKRISFKTGINQDDIKEYLNVSGRLCIFNCFLGNYNEMELLPLLLEHNEKIIFLTCLYDKTIKYISDELFRYCYYVDFSKIRIPEYKISKVNKTKFIESKYEYAASTENRNKKRLLKILNELEYNDFETKNYTDIVNTEEDLVSILLYSIIPYYFNVLNKNPFVISETLLHYCKQSKYYDDFKAYLNE